MKLLVATEFPPDAPGGGPAVVRQMLKGFPGEVHWWCCRGGVRGSSFLVGSSWFLVLGSRGGASNGWRVTSGEEDVGFEVRSFACCPPGKLGPGRKLPRLKAWLMEHIWAPQAVRSLQRTLDRVKPDAVWVVPHDWSILPLARVAGEGWRVKGRERSRVHVTIQDFPDCHGHGRVWGEARVERMARLQERIYASADTCDATSHPMIEELERRADKRGVQMLHQGLEREDFECLEFLVRGSSFGVRGDAGRGESELPVRGSSFLVRGDAKSLGAEVFPAILNDERRTKNKEQRTKNEEPIKIAYAGTILCEEEFVLFVELLDLANQKRTKTFELRTKNQERRTKNEKPRTPHIELHLFSAHSYADRPWFRPWMVERGNLPERELIAELRKCGWGFIPMRLEDTDPRYNRFSFPTKFITYLAAGLPPIVMGHPESSVMKMAEAYGVGVRITSNEWRVAGKNGSLCLVLGSSFLVRDSLLEEAGELVRLLGDDEMRRGMMEAVLRCARAEFDAERMRKTLWACWGEVRGS